MPNTATPLTGSNPKPSYTVPGNAPINVATAPGNNLPVAGTDISGSGEVIQLLTEDTGRLILMELQLIREHLEAR